MLVPDLIAALREPDLDRQELLSRLASCRGFYVPSFYDVSYDGDGRLARVRAQAGQRRAGGREEGGRQERRSPRSAGDVDLHPGHGVRLAVPHRGRPRVRQPLPVLLGRLQLSAGARLSRPTASSNSRRRRDSTPTASGWCRSPSATIPRSTASSTACSRSATRSAPRRCASTTSPTPSCGGCARAERRSITIAPETGSDRLRRVINKTVTNDEILEATELHLCQRHRQPEAVLHDRAADRDRRRPRCDSRHDASRCATS